MKQYIKGNKTLTVWKVSDNLIRFHFYNGKVFTNYFKSISEYESFLAYMLDIWFQVKRA